MITLNISEKHNTSQAAKAWRPILSRQEHSFESSYELEPLELNKAIGAKQGKSFDDTDNNVSNEESIETNHQSTNLLSLRESKAR